MPGTLPHTQNGFVQTAADQQLHDKRDPPASEDSDPTTLKFDGNVAISEDEGMDAEDSGGDPYNRTGRFRRFVR